MLAGPEVAASALFDMSVRDSQHRLFYKFDNDSDTPQTYTIDVNADVSGAVTDTFAVIEPNELQWSVRTWADTYVLDTTPTTNSCA